MAYLRDEEIRRLLSYFRDRIQAVDKLSALEDELTDEFGAEYLREPQILSYFSEQKIEIDFNKTKWVLRIIPYTSLRLIQRGIKVEMVKNLFLRFLEYCESNNEVIIPGAYSIFGRPTSQTPLMTLRMDVDEIDETSGKAHTVTIFVGRGNMENTQKVVLNP
ncbi:MAG: hypothetical protein ACRD6X_07665 [Pyrinomonadaceae bacterium]